MKSIQEEREECGGTVLVVDDSADNLQLLTGHLYDAGFEVQFARSGREALDRARSTPPDVIVLDIEMPDMNGFEVCQKLQSDACLRSIPVLFVTSHTDEEYLVRGFEVGGVDYITKPVRRSELISRVRTQQELKCARDRLHAQNEYLTQLNQRKDRFFSMLAHDLRSPFSGILTLARFMKESAEEGSTGDTREFVEALWEASSRLSRLLENLLEWGRLQLYSASAKPQELPVTPLVEEAAGLFEQVAREKGITIEQVVAADLTVFADPTMIDSVLRNLISNAIKFSHPGGQVTVRAAASDDRVRIAVRDTGVGISPERLERIFSDEILVSGVGTSGEKGTGLGLALSRLHAEQNGGTLAVTSTPGKGTTITLELPRTQS